MKYEEIRLLLKNYIMNTYDIRPSLAERTVEEMFKKGVDFISIEEQQPCEDAISRQAAIRWVKTECNPYGKPTLDFESGKKVIEHLKRMSPITPQPKTGHWISKIDFDDTHYGYTCDSCKLWVRDKTDYCPNCGAKMIEQQGSEDEK